MIMRISYKIIKLIKLNHSKNWLHFLTYYTVCVASYNTFITITQYTMNINTYWNKINHYHYKNKNRSKNKNNSIGSE